MRTIQGARASGLVAALGVVLVAGVARADVTTERPGSILIFPKVVRDGARETTIQITNTGNMPDTVRCFYLNAQTQAGGLPAEDRRAFGEPALDRQSATSVTPSATSGVSRAPVANSKIAISAFAVIAA
jgi:hypothetical protein